MKIKLTGATGEQFAKRAMKMVYDAAGRELGMGVFQARENADEDAVWDGAYNALDYPGGRNGLMRRGMKSTEVYGDYVFGRMIKWGLKWDGDTVEIREQEEFDREYQGFAHVYKNNAAIVDAVTKSLGASYEIIS